MTIHIPKVKEATIRHEGARVLLLLDGKVVLDMPWEAADALGKALQTKARDAEEIDKAPSIAFDQAILIRSGAPFIFSADEKIIAEAQKEAAWNTDLRRYMPGGIKSEEKFGRPAIINRKKKDEIK